MKRIMLVVWTLIVPCSLCLAQTNHPPSAKTKAPPVSLAGELQNTSPPLAHFEDVNAYNLTQTTQGAHPPEDGIISRIGREGLLALRPTVPASLRPKILHIGHVKIYSPVVTAVARKNPLCLLDATFLNISF
jgi:hypothetical protein